MLPASRRKILARLSSADTVLDVGGWADPLGRADWVIDVMPFGSRGLYRREGWVQRPAEAERFTEDTWVQRDLCDRRPWPFEDGQFDFVICSHTLEDVRDPVWACAELQRVGRAGYIEVPSRLEEQSWGVHGDFAGWSHHHWLIDVGEAHIDFSFKPHLLHSRPDCHFPAEFRAGLTARERVQTLWWETSFTCRERLFLEEHPEDAYLPEFVAEELRRRRGLGGRIRSRLTRRLRPDV